MNLYVEILLVVKCMLSFILKMFHICNKMRISNVVITIMIFQIHSPFTLQCRLSLLQGLKTFEIIAEKKKSICPFPTIFSVPPPEPCFLTEKNFGKNP